MRITIGSNQDGRDSQDDAGTTGEAGTALGGSALTSPDLAGPDLASPRAAGPTSAVPPTARRTGWLGARSLGWTAAICVGAAIAIMIWLSASAPNVGLPVISRLRPGPPWWPHGLRPPIADIVAASWLSAILSGAGVLAGLAAVARGARPRSSLLIAPAVAVVAILTVLPPAGSDDLLNYATYGRMVVVGVNPYVVTPSQLAKRTGDPVARLTVHWNKTVSVYGPLATAEEWAAAELGGTSAGRIAFWLKLWNALAFLAVMLALDRRLRSDPARRARAHLLWTLNPLLLWGLVAAGHADGLAAAIGFAGVLVLTTGRDGKLAVPQALAAGILTGLATDIKISFVLFTLGAAWAARRSRAALAAVITGAAIVLVPSFAVFSRSALDAILSRGGASTWDSLYKLVYTPFGYHRPHLPGLSLLAGTLFVAVAAVALRWLPDRYPELPAVRPVLALSLAWLLTWPFQRPWYDAMVLCLLALYPASAIDWVVLIRLAVGYLALAPSLTLAQAHRIWPPFQHALNGWAIFPPLLRLLALAAFVTICVRHGRVKRTRARPG